MPPPVRILVTRTYPAPAAAVFDWCTDYREDDASISNGFIAGRRIIERGPGRVRIETRVRLAVGERSRIQEISLHPKDHRWELDIVEGHGVGSHHVYRAVPTPDGGSRLEIRFGYRARTWREWWAMWRGRHETKAGLERLWDGLSRALEKDLAAVKAA